METIEQPRFNLAACYVKAWKAFAKWWIPICLIAGGLMIFEWLPKQLTKAESSAASQTIGQIVTAFEQNDLERVEEQMVELNEVFWIYAKTIATFTLYAAPFVAVLTIVLLCMSVMAVKDRRIRYAPGRVLWVAVLNLFMAFAKVFLLFLIFPLGIYIYIKLYFVTLVMMEEGKSFFEAIQRSWDLSTGVFWPLFGMVALNGILQLVMLPTLVGLIPASGFTHTVRTSAFELLRAGESSVESALC